MKTEPTIGCGSLEGVTTSLGATSYDARRIDRMIKNGGNDFTTSLGATDYAEDSDQDSALSQAMKQTRYLDRKGEDWIDEFARTATIDEFRGAMRFTIGKYNRRAGKKDELISEIRKMRDYCDRWIAYEEDVNE